MSKMQAVRISDKALGGELSKFAKALFAGELNDDQAQDGWKNLFKKAQAAGVIPKTEKYDQINLHICGNGESVIATEMTDADGNLEVTEDEYLDVMTGENLN